MTEQYPMRRRIAILGGTGKEGKGLAYRWAKAGHRIIIGSRYIEKALIAANSIKALLDRPTDIVGMLNPQAAEQGEVIVLTVPYTFHKEMLEELKGPLHGKILIDVTVPLVPPRVTRVQMPPEGSAAQEAKKILGEEVQVVAAFQNISYEHLLHEEEIECDVLVCGGDKPSRGIVIQLVQDAGLVGWDAGPIENAVVVEGMTSILIGINKQFGVSSAGIRITGVKDRKDLCH